MNAMTDQGIKKLFIRGVGCLKNVNLDLSRLHALIGPNDSGKSTMLRAIQCLASTVAQRFGTPIDPFNPLPSASGVTPMVTAQVHGGSVQLLGGARLQVQLGAFDEKTWGQNAIDIGSRLSIGEDRYAVAKQLAGAVLLRLDPDVLRLPASLIPHGAPLRFKDERGQGLAAIYDAILVRDTDRFQEIGRQVRTLFPAVKKIVLRNVTDGSKGLAFVLTDDTEIGAEQASEGLLYFLAYMALESLDKPAFLLVEEPENGLHPARIQEVMNVLRAISDKMQVILATHSPLVINELKGQEVTVMTRDPLQGTAATVLSNTPHFEERHKVYATGELWVSYADGQVEAPLLKESLVP
jgi:energy-coupling factor transporter ATP-binding protein EcfA2